MGEDLTDIGLLVRREMEARIAGPLIKAFVLEFGEVKTVKILEDVIESLARENGSQLAMVIGGNTIEHLGKAFQLLSQDNILEQEIIEQDATKLYINCTKCRFVDMYDELDMPGLGYLLSCNRDFAMTEGFNPKIKLTRTQTIMEGANYCDFRFHLEGGE